MTTNDRPNSAPAQRAAKYSAGATRNLALAAEELLAGVSQAAPIEGLMEQVLEHSDELLESERQQLNVITKLMSGQPADLEKIERYARPAAFALMESPDKMFLTLAITPAMAGGKPVEVNEVVQALKEMGVTKGVELPAIARAVKSASEGEPVKDVVVVRGRPPKPGRAGTVVYYARRTSGGPLEELDESAIAGQATHPLFCQEGDRLTAVQAPEPGTSGYTATGEPLPAPAVDPPTVTTGPNVRVEDGEVLATTGGVVVIDGRGVEVVKALVLVQDVSRATGVVEFDGEVHVRGAVRSGARIRATQRVIVEGLVEAAQVHSVEGDVVLHSGVAGQNRAEVRAGRDVVTRFAENAQVFAMRDVHLLVGSLHSHLTAGRAVLAMDNKGSVAGGMVVAGERVEVRQLGAKGGSPTSVTVGIGGDALLQLEQLDARAVRVAAQIAECESVIEQFGRAVGDPQKLSEAEFQPYLKLRQAKLGLEFQARQLQEARRTLIENSEKSRSGCVKAHVNVFSKVTVTIGSRKRELDEGRGPITVSYDESSQSLKVTRRA